MFDGLAAHNWCMCVGRDIAFRDGRQRRRRSDRGCEDSVLGCVRVACSGNRGVVVVRRGRNPVGQSSDREYGTA